MPAYSEDRIVSKLRNVFMALVVAAFAFGCSLSTEDLSSQVQADMEKTLAERDIKIKSFGLTKKGGNEYKGILETIEPFGEFTYTVEVIYDGNMFAWEIEG